MEEKDLELEKSDAEVKHPDYKGEIADIVKSGLSPATLREKLLDYHENDIAAALELLTEAERRKLYAILDAATLAGILEYAEELNEYIGELSIRKKVAVLEGLEVPAAVGYLSSIARADRATLLDLMNEDVKKEITLSLSFDEDEIGSRMTTNYISIGSGLGIWQAMRELVDQAAVNDNISTIYVTASDGTLSGAIDLKDLIIAREGTSLDSIVMTSYPYVYADEQITDCIERLKNYSEDSIPVLDSDNKLCGVLTAQAITELVDDEMGDDYAKLAGLTAEDDLKEPLIRSIGKRLPWLIVLLGLGLVVSSIVGIFEHVVSHLALIVAFQSLVLDMAGNVGTQSLAVTIRVLMDEQISGKEKFMLVLREARVGFFNGLILGTLSFAFVGLYLFALKGQTPMDAFSMSFCTGAALLVSMLFSSLAGTVIPMFFKKIKIDPAVASGPLITTINDLVAVVTYYGLAWALLIGVMHM